MRDGASVVFFFFRNFMLWFHKYKFYFEKKNEIIALNTYRLKVHLKKYRFEQQETLSNNNDVFSSICLMSNFTEWIPIKRKKLFIIFPIPKKIYFTIAKQTIKKYYEFWYTSKIFYIFQICKFLILAKSSKWTALKNTWIQLDCYNICKIISRKLFTVSEKLISNWSKS